VDLGILIFGALGVVVGRLGSVCSLYIPDMYHIKSGFWPFFIKCQKEWGCLPLFYFLRNIRSKAIFSNLLVIELLFPALYILLFYRMGWGYMSIEYVLFIFGLIVASAIDVEHMILPDSLTLSGIIFGLAGAILNPDPSRGGFLASVLGLFMGGGMLWLVAVLYYVFRKEEGLGGGDIKLLAWIGTVLTWKAIPFVVLVSCFSGLFAAVFSMIYSRRNLNTGIPFGPFLSFAALVYIFYGEELENSYLSFFFPFL